MIIKVYNSTEYVFIEKNKYIQIKNYYDEMIRIKFNKKHNVINEIENLRQKIKLLKN